MTPLNANVPAANQGGRENHARTLPQFVRDLLSSPPQRGKGLNLWLYRVARVLHPYRDSAEIIELLGAATAGEPIKHGEIERAVDRSKATAWKPGQAPQNTTRLTAWPKVNVEQREAAIESGAGLVDLWENSPVQFEDNKSHTEEIIDALFPGNPLLCCGRSNSDFETKLREEWHGQLAALQLIVPSPMTARVGHTQDGKESARVCKKSRQFVKTIRRKRESQIRVQEKPLVFHPLAQQTVFRCRDVRPLSRSFVRENQSLRSSLNSNALC